MKKLIVSILVFLSTTIASAQQTPLVGGYNVVQGATICKINEGFGIQGLNPGTLLNQQWPGSFTISLEIFIVNNLNVSYNPFQEQNPWQQEIFPPCLSPPTTNPIRLENININANGCTTNNPGNWNPDRFDFEFTSTPNNSNPIDINFSVYLDCTILSMISGGSLQIVEQWYYNGLPLTTPSPNLNPVPVHWPHIVPVVPAQQFVTMPAPNGQSAEWVFMYQNNGNADVDIKFQFQVDACQNYILGDIYYTIIPNLQTPPSFPGTPNYNNNQGSIVIASGAFLVIKQEVVIAGCARDCDPVYTRFSWKCNISNANNCTDCQQEYKTMIVFDPGVESYTVSRLQPTLTSTAVHNTECQGSTTPWKFRIINTGQTELDQISVTILNDHAIHSSLSMVDANGIIFTKSNSNINASISPPILLNPIPGPIANCTTSVPNPVNEFSTLIYNLKPTEYVDIEFIETHCCSEDMGLLNTPKYFNQWKIETTCLNACGDVLPPDIANDPDEIAIVSPPSGISGYSNVIGNGNEDLHLSIGFNTMTTHLTVPFNTPAPYFAPAPAYLYMQMNGLFIGTNDQQALGYSAANSTVVSGILKVEIFCEQGLGIDDYTDVYFEFPVIPGPAIRYDPEFFEAFDHTCVAQTYTFYFRLSDIVALGINPEDLFTTANFVFGLTACCPFATNPVNYDVKFSLLRNELCFDFIQGTCTPEPQSGFDCCWLPLSSKGGKIQVHCPGCRAPGTIVYKYELFRTSLGFEDVNDNGRILPNASRIDFMPGSTAALSPYPAYPYIMSYNNLAKSVYGDSLEDYLVARFEDGSVTGSIMGYTYDDMKNHQIELNILQLYREMPFFGSQDMNVQIAGFDLYIDDSNLPPADPCVDLEFFNNAATMDIPTGVHIEFDFSLYTPPPNLFVRGTGTEDHRMLFTFEESFLNALINNPNPPVGVTVTMPSTASTWTVDYDINQQYRLRMRYVTCGNFHDPDWNADVTTLEKESEIENFMFLRGMVPLTFSNINQYNDITSLQMPNSCSELLSMANLCLNPPCSNTNCTPANQSNLADAFNFYCEPSGCSHTFLSTDLLNYTSYHRDNIGPDCKAYMMVSAINTFSRGGFNQKFDFEFKQPRIFPGNFSITAPSGWNFVTNSGSVSMEHRSSTKLNAGIASNFQALTGVSPAATINFPLAQFSFNCLEESVNTTPFIADEYSCQNLKIMLERIDCDPPLPPNTTPPYYDVVDSEVVFSDNQENCNFDHELCGFNQVQNNMAPDNVRFIYPFAPGLSGVIYPPVFSTYNGTVSWQFEISNMATPLIPNPTSAKNVYISLPDGLNNVFTNWSISYNRRKYIPLQNYPPVQSYTLNSASAGNYFWLNPTSAPNNPAHYGLPVNQFYEGTISADYTCTSPPPNFDFIFGWNCWRPIIHATQVDLCMEQPVPIQIQTSPGFLTAFNHTYTPNQYTPCDPNPIVVQAFFQNVNQVEVHPDLITFSFGPNVSISNISVISYPSGAPHPDYIIQGLSGNSYTILDAGPLDFMGQGDLIGIQFYLTADCNFNNLQMPVVTLSGTDICGSSIYCNYSLPFMGPSGNSLCDDCYQITKTASPGIVQGGDPVTFNITVTGNNATATTVILDDLLPSGFIANPPVSFPINNFQVPANPVNPATYTVTGNFNQTGLCPNNPNLTNTATITYPTGSQSASVCVDVFCPGGTANDYHVDNDNLASVIFGGISPPTGSKIFVADYVKLGIDFNITFDKCTFVMGSGSRIEIAPSKSMSLINNSLIYSCPLMWRGIILKEQSQGNTATTLKIVSSTVKDADEAVFAEANTSFWIIDSQIYDGVKGVVTEQTGQLENTFGYVSGSSFGRMAPMLKGAYNGQTPYGTLGRAGMLLNDVVMTIGDNTANANEFFNINYGMEIHNSDINVTNSRFYDIVPDNFYLNAGVLKPNGCAINARATRDNMHLNVSPLASTGIKTISGANVGVYTNYYNARVTDVSMEDVNKGVNSEGSLTCSVSVTGCVINAFHRGIDWVDNDGANEMLASGNTIIVEPTGSGLTKGLACIAMSEVNSPNNAHYIISDNSHLETRSAHFGISATNVENALLQNNFIYTNQVGVSPPGTQGIILNGGGGNTVSCNTVANTIPHSNTGTIGMNVNLSTNNTMECNVFGTNQVPGTIGPYTGMQFGGDCDILNDLAGNVMNDCPVGLYLNSASRIGTQFHKGNKWNNPQIGNTTAINQNPNFGNSEFWVNTTSGIQYWPNTITPPQWFVPDPTGNTFNGCGSQVCIPAFAGGGGDEEHLKEVAKDSAISFDYREENLNQAQFNLYSLLKEDSLLRTSDSVFQNFYINKQSVAIGQLQEIKHDLYESGRFTVQQQETFAVADGMVKIKLDSIAVLDSLFAINPLTYYLTERESLVYGINIINGSIDSVLQQHEIMADSLYIAASVKNSAVQPLEIPEGNHKGFNDILIQFRTLGDSIISGNYASLLSIAHQCPYAGGKAVYQARAMLAMLNDSIEYFDDMICLQSGIYRILQNPVSQSSAFDFKIIPNPASQKVTIELADLAEEKVHLEIRNVLGGLIQEIVMDKGIRSIVFSVGNFNQGIYFVRIRKDGITLNAKRLVIIK